jgi:uncharacterized protein
MTRALLLAFAALTLAACAGEPRDLPVASIDCRTGLYRSADGEALALTPTTGGGYRWRLMDGRTGAIAQEGEGWISTQGWTEESDGTLIELGACSDDELRMGPAGALVSYMRAPLDITDITFEHDGLQFSGRLIWPAGVEHAPLAVHTHGSERWSAVRSGSMAYLLASEGIASFVYDKRGTGRSEGKYTQDFYVLASDAIAALAQARALAGNRITEIGFLGGSQGGWISPLAASQSDVDFVVALYGMAEGALAEDRAQVMRDVAQAGFGPEEQARAAELSDAAGVIMASHFREGFAEFDRLRRLYREQPWYASVQGEFTGEMLPHHEVALRLIGPFHDLGTSWAYEPMPVLRELEVPQFWMIAADDAEAPPEETIRRLRTLQAEGRPIDLAIYPNADHGMVLLEPQAEGEPRRVGHVRGYYSQIAAWIRTRDMSAARSAGAEVYAANAPATASARPAP